jgi:hypothetical protein
MAYRFRKTDGTVEAGFRRIACAQIDEALALIAADDLPPERVVHRVRQCCKAVRGLIRLVRPVFPGYAHENAAFRDIAQLLAGARDGKVLVDTLDALTRAPDVAIDLRALGQVRTWLARRGSKSGPLRQRLDQCREMLLATRVRAASWTLTADGWDALSGGLARTARAARRAMKALAESDSPALSHEWRKHVKYHWQHVRLLRDIAPDAMRRHAKRADKLAVMLGDRHDLDLFVKTLAEPREPSRDQTIVERLVVKAQARAVALGDKALGRGKHLFAEKPRKLAMCWGERWPM